MAPKTQIKKNSKLYHKDARKAKEAQDREVCHVCVEQLFIICIIGFFAIDGCRYICSHFLQGISIGSYNSVKVCILYWVKC